jgi:hypothetical protein
MFLTVMESKHVGVGDFLESIQAKGAVYINMHAYECEEVCTRSAWWHTVGVCMLMEVSVDRFRAQLYQEWNCGRIVYQCHWG